jgi:prevent-host-death family protein
VETIGVRELKAHLSRHLKRVQAGTRLVVTDRGRAVATISPTDAAGASEANAWAHDLVATGRASWGGGKPSGVVGVILAEGPSMAETVLDHRR